MAALFGSRRRFLLALIGGAALFSGLGKFLRPRPLQRKVIVDVPLADIPLYGSLVFSEERVALVRGDKGVYALGLVCTHLGCTVSVMPDGLFCPCHGTRFDQEGNVLQGPATRPLPRLKTESRGDRIIVTG